MQFTLFALTSLLAIASAEFAKDQPWGKRDYNCINVYQGIPAGAILDRGTEVTIKFNRESVDCTSLQQYAGSDYRLWAVSNPVRNPDVSYDAEEVIATDIKESSGTVSFKVPAFTTTNETVWYFRLDTALDSAPQMPTLFNAMGPITLV